ncbi:MAG: hypothetical protein SOX14_02900, partial [Ruminococcus callidus]|nr:hypothetical protein [Ruminococcus callidus]
EAYDLFYTYKSSNPLISGNYVENADGNEVNGVAYKDGSYERYWSLSGGTFYNDNWCNGNSIKIPVKRGLSKRRLLTFIQYGLVPSKSSFKDLYKMLADMYDKKIITASDDKILYKYNDVKESEFYQSLKGLYINSYDTKKLKSELLNVDKKRCDRDTYEETILTDDGAGHWDLWEKSSQEGTEIALTEKLIARNPLADVLDDGIIGIDFGTRSTVVGYQNGRDVTHLLRIGKNKLGEEAKKEDYENPTVIEFDDIESFMQAYSAKAGRPDTSWDDIKVSHTANYNFKNTTEKKDSDNFYSYFYNLKQWCGNTTKETAETIKSLNTKTEKKLYKYVDLKEDDFDPIEIYAYYLGLYINNMTNKIYLRYIMSFPVTYEKQVREKILESFTKGLKKSLPETVLNDEATMKKFEVKAGAGEPASYAVCALKEFNCAPGDDSSILYGIFDFGGGTTDFDYGTWRYANEDDFDEEDYDYVIEHFGAAGSKYLGGENLLELLAYEVFKANKKVLLENRITFTKPVQCDVFDGHDELIKDTQIAKRNTKQLAEALRPFMEESIYLVGDETKELDGELKAKLEYSINEAKKEYGVESKEYIGYVKELCEGLGISPDKYLKNNSSDNEKFPVYEIESSFEALNSGLLKVNLFDVTGEFKEIELKLESPNDNIHVDLLGILSKQIEEGINNFCHGFLQAISSEKLKAKNIKISNIYIFIAGNAGKSPIVENVFNQYINEYFPDICKICNVDFKRNLFLMPPLGTEDADKLQKQAGKEIDVNSLTRPTGKTGVVYGLIDSREDGKILVLSDNDVEDEIPFKYFVGISKREMFKVIMKMGSEYGKWIKFKNAKVDKFEIYYTSLPVALNGGLSISDSSIIRKNLRIEQTFSDKDVAIYIRAVKPYAIEYAVAKESEIENEKYLLNPIEVNLK